MSDQDRTKQEDKERAESSNANVLPKSELDEMMGALNKDPEKYYRLIRNDDKNLSIKQARGFTLVTSEDSAVKGTILARSKNASGHIQIGDVVLATTSRKNADARRARVAERTDRKLRAITETYKEQGEAIKRKLGKLHKHFKPIVKLEE